MWEEVIREDEYVDICPNCGGLFSQNAKGRRKIFCSTKCRMAWNHRHPNKARWKDTARTVVCPQCGTAFDDPSAVPNFCPKCGQKLG